MGSNLLNILVLGYYCHNNLGDDLFMEAFKIIFPEINFVFVDNIKENDLINIDTAFIGGGSFLNMKPTITESALQLLLHKNIFYIGVGTETNIHETHKLLMSKAKLIATRFDNTDKIKEINSNVMSIPDLVYSLQDQICQTTKIKNSILVIPNITAVPQWDAPYWKQLAWEHYKIELSQFLDELISQKYVVNFLPMCQDNKLNDNWAIAEIFNKMKNRNNNFIYNVECNMISISQLISKYEMVITQRYHGAILADMCNVSCINVYHHDKLKTSNAISFYEASKDKFYEKLNRAKIDENILIKQNINRERFIDLNHRVKNFLI